MLESESLIIKGKLKGLTVLRALSIRLMKSDAPAKLTGSNLWVSRKSIWKLYEVFTTYICWNWQLYHLTFLTFIVQALSSRRALEPSAQRFANPVGKKTLYGCEALQNIFKALHFLYNLRMGSIVRVLCYTKLDTHARLLCLFTRKWSIVNATQNIRYRFVF